MIKGWLIYDERDLEKNKKFADYIIACGKEARLDITLIIRQEIQFGTEENKLYIKTINNDTVPFFCINRSRDTLLSYHLEKMQVLLFNSANVTEIGNDKIKAHQMINSLGVHSVKNYFFDKHFGEYNQNEFKYPVVIKTIDGHGGDEVFKVDNKKDFDKTIKDIKRRYILIQELCDAPGVDVRVFVVGNKPVAAIKRTSTTDFRSNFSLGGSVVMYKIDDELKKHIKTITDYLFCDCVGIDFLIDKKGNYLFNEIEDVVGCRSLYEKSDVDLAKIYVEHIAYMVNKK
ncbi:MAG: ATP-grasp domain-containing protein [Cellulosilyticaceae bacterium]